MSTVIAGFPFRRYRSEREVGAMTGRQLHKLPIHTQNPGMVIRNGTWRKIDGDKKGGGNGS